MFLITQVQRLRLYVAMGTAYHASLMVTKKKKKKAVSTFINRQEVIDLSYKKKIIKKGIDSAVILTLHTDYLGDTKV